MSDVPLDQVRLQAFFIHPFAGQGQPTARDIQTYSLKAVFLKPDNMTTIPTTQIQNTATSIFHQFRDNRKEARKWLSEDASILTIDCFPRMVIAVHKSFLNLAF